MTIASTRTQRNTAAGRAARSLSGRTASVAALAIALLWTVPTFGLLVTSFRPEKEINTSGWWNVLAHPDLTLENYRTVLASTGQSALQPYFVNTIVITIPAVVIPIVLALLASYALTWIDFKGRDLVFVGLFALQIVPIQVTLLPLLKLYNQTGLAGSFASVWLSHTTFALPLAIYLLSNFMREIPGELVEAARVDGAKHVTILLRVLMPLLTPAIAAFAIFQFLWVWNDLLVGLTFASGNAIKPVTVGLLNLSGTRGADWYLLSAGAFISIMVPVAVFLSLQRYFVRGLLAGGLKG